MPNALITPSIIAREAIMQLDNNLVMGGLVHRGYEGEFNNTVNGNKPGSSITIRRPVQFTVRSGATASIQDVTEATTSISVDKQKGVDFKFASSDMTLSVTEFSDRYIKPAMIQLANQIDIDLLALYKSIPNWVGTPGQTVNSFSDFALAPQRMTEQAVPVEGRMSVLSPADHWGMLGNFTSLYVQDTAKSALEKAKLPMIGGVDMYHTQNVQTHTTGALAGTPLINGASQNVTYAAAPTVETQSLVTDGWTASTTIKEGDVFTIANVYDVNPVTKATLTNLKQFVVRADATADGSGNATLTIYPKIISSGAFQTVSAAPADNAAMTKLGSGSTGYAQNVVFTKSAFALAIVPMERPAGAVDVVQESYKNISVRLIPYYDGTNDVSSYRLDVLYGVKAIDPRQAVRLSGS